MYVVFTADLFEQNDIVNSSDPGMGQHSSYTHPK